MSETETQQQKDVRAIFDRAKAPQQQTAQAAPTVATTPKPPHSAFFVFKILGPEAQGGEAFKRVAPGLRKERANEGMILLALVLLSAIISSFGGIAIYSYTHPPIQLVGVCQSPAQIRGGDCVLAETSTNSQGQQTTVYVPAGQIYFVNGTQYTGPH